MASAQAAIDLDVSADEVWELIGGFGSLTDWMPSFISKSTLVDGGRVRKLVTVGGQTIVEQLEEYGRDERKYSYSILDAPFPVTDYLATIIVVPGEDGNSCRIEWSGTFTPKGVSGEEVHKLFQQIFTAGLEGLATKCREKTRNMAMEDLYAKEHR